MLFICDEAPKACAGCGREMGFNSLAMQDWNAGASHQCPECLSMYQLVPREAIIEVANEHGDLKRYA